MTRADLTEEVCQAIELPKKESDVVVCTIFDSIVRALRSGDKVEIRGFDRAHNMISRLR
jgi:integration host factor subunit beta